MTFCAPSLTILIHQMFQDCIVSFTTAVIGVVEQIEQKKTLHYFAARWRNIIINFFLLKHHISYQKDNVCFCKYQ